jgi:hypothetical protein
MSNEEYSAYQLEIKQLRIVIRALKSLALSAMTLMGTGDSLKDSVNTLCAEVGE